MVQPHLPLAFNSHRLTEELLWEILCYAAIEQTTIESACLALAAAPSGNTVRAHLSTALEPTREGLTKVEAQLTCALQAQLPARVRHRLTRTHYEVAIDLVEIPYHGSAIADEAEVRRSAAKAGTTHFHMYGTLAIVHHRQRYTLALTFVWAGETMAEVVERLLGAARRLGLRIKCAYLDKGFCSTAVMRRLRQRRVPYIIPIPARGGAGGIRALFRGRHSYRTHYTFKRGRADRYTTDVVIVCKYGAGRYHKRGLRYFAYAVYRCGLRPNQVFEHYRRRFSIESGYRQLHQVRARTSSRHPGLRLLLVGLALLLVNLWVSLSQTWFGLTCYGQRWRIINLTLQRIKEALQHHIRQGLAGMPVFQLEAVLHGS